MKNSGKRSDWRSLNYNDAQLFTSVYCCAEAIITSEVAAVLLANLLIVAVLVFFA
jgi:hypothetical protein